MNKRKLKCVVLSADMTPCSLVTSEEALVAYFKDRVYILENHEGEVIRSVSQEFPCPSVVCHKTYHNLPNYYYVTATLTLDNLKTRDNYTCQFCARKTKELRADEFWTMDHVMPRDHGGEHRWENVVLSCNTCNNRKRNRTPEGAEMPLINGYRIITVPTRWHIEQLRGV